MNKKAFTLIEMLISIAILVTVVGFFVFFIADTRTKTAIQANAKERTREQSVTKNILYNDLALSKEKPQIVGGATFRILYLQTDNSLYGVGRPYVAWAVLSDNRLVRYESAYKFALPITTENQNTIFAHIALKECSKFVVFPSKDNKAFAVFIESNGDKNQIFLTAPITKSE